MDRMRRVRAELSDCSNLSCDSGMPSPIVRAGSSTGEMPNDRAPEPRSPAKLFDDKAFLSVA